MNNYQLFFAILGAVLYLIGFVPYIYHVFHGRVVPHAFSWTVWAILSGINTYILVLQSWLDSSIISPTIRTSCLCIGSIVWWFYIRKVHISRWDILAIFLAWICLMVAYLYGAENAVIPTILVDMLVLFPTIRKIYDNPDTEDAFTWFLVVFSQLATIASFPVHTLNNSLYWWYEVFVNLLVGLYILRMQRNFHSWRYVFVRIIRRLR